MRRQLRVPIGDVLPALGAQHDLPSVRLEVALVCCCRTPSADYEPAALTAELPAPVPPRPRGGRSSANASRRTRIREHSRWHRPAACPGCDRLRRSGSATAQLDRRPCRLPVRRSRRPRPRRSRRTRRWRWRRCLGLLVVVRKRQDRDGDDAQEHHEAHAGDDHSGDAGQAAGPRVHLRIGQLTHGNSIRRLVPGQAASKRCAATAQEAMHCSTRSTPRTSSKPVSRQPERIGAAAAAGSRPCPCYRTAARRPHLRRRP
jgi:hypothetical protein